MMTRGNGGLSVGKGPRMSQTTDSGSERTKVRKVSYTVFGRGRRSAHLRDETIEPVGNRFARPGLTH